MKIVVIADVLQVSILAKNIDLPLLQKSMTIVKRIFFEPFYYCPKIVLVQDKSTNKLNKKLHHT